MDTSLFITPVQGVGRVRWAGYQARERQKVTRRRMDTRSKSDKPYLTLAEVMSFCRLNFSSLEHRRRRGAVSGSAGGREGGFKSKFFQRIQCGSRWKTAVSQGNRGKRGRHMVLPQLQSLLTYLSGELFPLLLLAIEGSHPLECLQGL